MSELIHCAVFGPMEAQDEPSHVGGYDVQIRTPNGMVFVQFDNQFVPYDISRATAGKVTHYVPPPHSAGVVVTEEMVERALVGFEGIMGWTATSRTGGIFEERVNDAMRAALVAALDGEGDGWAQLASDCGMTPDCDTREEFVRLMKMVVAQANNPQSAP